MFPHLIVYESFPILWFCRFFRVSSVFCIAYLAFEIMRASFAFKIVNAVLCFYQNKPQTSGLILSRHFISYIFIMVLNIHIHLCLS